MSDDAAMDDGVLDDVVLVEIDGRVAVITLNRPAKRNALNRAVQRRLPEIVTQLEADDGVDVVACGTHLPGAAKPDGLGQQDRQPPAGLDAHALSLIHI